MKIERDKWRHFYVGMAIGLLLQITALFVFPAFILWSTLTVLFLLAGINYGFEVLSLILKRGHYDVIDAVAGMIGGLIGMAAAFALYFFINL